MIQGSLRSPLLQKTGMFLKNGLRSGKCSVFASGSLDRIPALHLTGGQEGDDGTFIPLLGL